MIDCKVDSLFMEQSNEQELHLTLVELTLSRVHNQHHRHHHHHHHYPEQTHFHRRHEPRLREMLASDTMAIYGIEIPQPP